MGSPINANEITYSPKTGRQSYYDVVVFEVSAL